MKAICLKCGKYNGPNVPVNGDYAGWICPKCYRGQATHNEGPAHVWRKAMTCHCGKTAIWYVGSTGYCREHKTEAYAAAAKEKQLQNSVQGLLTLDHERRRRDEREVIWHHRF